MRRVAGWIEAFGRFWWDFIVGDDWTIGAGVLVALAGTVRARAQPRAAGLVASARGGRRPRRHRGAARRPARAGATVACGVPDDGDSSEAVGRVTTLLRALRFALTRQASAYGFTLIVWGTGEIAASRLGGPDPLEVLAFAGGALAAAVLIVVLAFGISTALRAREPRRRAYSAMHVPSVPAAIGSGWGVVLLLGGPGGYFVAAFTAVLVYESLLSVEIGLATIGPPPPADRR